MAADRDPRDAALPGRGSPSAAVPGPPPPSGVESTNLPERSVHDPGQPRRIRRRRSQLQMPAVVAPIDVAEDAEGRVEFIVARVPGDRDEDGPAPPPPPPALTGGRTIEALNAASGWIAVAVLAAALVVIFLVGTALVR